MRQAIFYDRLNPVEHELKARGAQGRTLPLGVEAAPEERRPEPVLIVVDLAIAYPEVREQDAARAQPDRK